MPKIMEEIIGRLRDVPESVQDDVASTVAKLLEEYPSRDEIEAMDRGWHEYERGEFVPLYQVRNELGAGTE